jgi:hypothetical protein
MQRNEVLARLVIAAAVVGIVGHVCYVATYAPTCRTPGPATRVASEAIELVLLYNMKPEDLESSTLSREENRFNATAEFVCARYAEHLDELESYNLTYSDTDQDGLNEISDWYGNPMIVYLDCQSVSFMNQDGKECFIELVGIEPGKSFAVWSMGPNGVNEYGSGDDMAWACVMIENGKRVAKGRFVSVIEWTQ